MEGVWGLGLGLGLGFHVRVSSRVRVRVRIRVKVRLGGWERVCLHGGIDAQPSVCLSVFFLTI